MQSGPDATAEFQQRLNDPQRWVIKRGVPLFKAHERTDPATGQLIKVDLPKLYRIASNMQRLERRDGVPVRTTLGHTEPEKPETQQPPVAAYYKNARVQPFGPKGEAAIVADEWLDPQYAPVRKNYPYRSAEYYDDAEQITGVALLTRDPYLDLGVVAYERGDSLVCYTADSKPDRRVNYQRNGRRPVLYHLVMGEVPMQPQPTNYGNWGGAAQGAVQGGITGARLGAGRGPYGAAVGGAAGAVAGGYHGYHEPPSQPTQNTAYGTLSDNSNMIGDGLMGAGMGAMHGGAGGALVGAGLGASTGALQDKFQKGIDHAGDAGRFSRYEDHDMNGTPYAGGQWPWHSEHVPGKIGQHHDSAWRFAADRSPAGYEMGGIVPGMGMMGGHTQGPAGAVMGAMNNSRYANNPGRTRPPGRYAEEPPMPPGGGGPPGGPGGGDPLQQLQMLLMGAVEILGQMTGGGGAGPGGPPPGPPEGPMPPEGEEYARYQAQQRYAQQRYAQQGQQRPAPARGYGRQAYEQPQAPVPYGAPDPRLAQPQRTISGRPVGEALELSKLNYQLQQQGQVIKMLAYERDRADTNECVTNIQRLADMGYPVGELEVGELKAKAPDQRDGYIQNIMTKYQKIGTEMMPQVLGDPTPAGPDPNLNRPTTKEEMEAALKIAAQNPADPLAYNRALESIRYGRQGGQPLQYGQQLAPQPVNRIANIPAQQQDFAQAYEWQPSARPGFDPANPHNEPSRNGQY